jgi:hypothetical protein
VQKTYWRAKHVQFTSINKATAHRVLQMRELSADRQIQLSILYIMAEGFRALTDPHVHVHCSREQDQVDEQ